MMKRSSRILMIAGIIICLGAAFCATHYKSIFHTDIIEREEDEEEESGVAGQMSSWYWSRGYPDPSHLDDKYIQAWQQAQAMNNPDIQLAGSGTNTGSTNSQNRLEYGAWASIGPSTNIGGRILSLAVHPTTTTTL